MITAARNSVVALEEDPGMREYEAARLLGISPRTIQRRRILKEFPEPDWFETWSGRPVPIWKLSTLRTYKMSLRVVQ